MGKVYRRTSVYPCLKDIYIQGVQFGKAGRILIDSGEYDLFVPGMINICLALEIFLKSISASMECIEDETEVDGHKVYVGRDGTLKISPSGKGHKLSELFEGLPDDAKKEISAITKKEGLLIDISNTLKTYDNFFIEWRYIYEKTSPKNFCKTPLFNIFSAVERYCKNHCDDNPSSRADVDV